MSSWHNKQVVIREKRSVREVEVELRDGNAWARIHVDCGICSAFFDPAWQSALFSRRKLNMYFTSILKRKIPSTVCHFTSTKLGYRKRRAQKAHTATHARSTNEKWQRRRSSRPAGTSELTIPSSSTSLLDKHDPMAICGFLYLLPR